MTRITTAAVALLVLLATAGTATALPGDAAGSNEAGDPGPPGGLPDVVPDFVSDILDGVGDMVSGILDAVVPDVAVENSPVLG